MNEQKLDAPHLNVTVDHGGARKILGVGRTKFAELRKLADFPTSIKLGEGRCERFKTTELIDWLDRQPRSAAVEPAALANARRYRDGKPVGTSKFELPQP